MKRRPPKEVGLPMPDEMGLDEFLDTMHPIPNHMNPDACCDGCMFDTHGPEGQFVRSQPSERIWTRVEPGYDDLPDVVVRGYHLVNRIGYFITKS